MGTALGALLLSCAAARTASIAELETRAPDASEARGLPRGVRVNGQVVTRVQADGVDLRPGDVILKLDDTLVYSRDDIDDFLRTLRPGKTVRVLVRRDVETAVEATFAPVPRGGFRWDYASLSRLEAALRQAQAEKKLVLVGLSGAET
jgi:hypothetical protein